MNELLSDTLWPTVRRLAKTSSAKRAAVAYVTSEDVVKFRKGDLLVTDASNHAIACGDTSANLLADLFERGVELYSLAGLHSKVMVLGGAAVIGSANLSRSSTDRLVEAAWVSDTPTAVGMATSLIHEMKGKSEEIGPAFISRILKIKVRRRPRTATLGKKATKVKTPRHRSWIVGIYELTRDYPAEQSDIETGEAIAEEKVSASTSDVAWIRWTGNSKFRAMAKEGDSVIQIWSPRRASNPAAVYRHSAIVHRQDEQTCTRFFIEQLADCDDTTMTWSSFKKLLSRVGVGREIKPRSVWEIPEATSSALYSLWGQ